MLAASGPKLYFPRSATVRSESMKYSTISASIPAIRACAKYMLGIEEVLYSPVPMKLSSHIYIYIHIYIYVYLSHQGTMNVIESLGEWSAITSSTAIGEATKQCKPVKILVASDDQILILEKCFNKKDTSLCLQNKS